MAPKSTSSGSTTDQKNNNNNNDGNAGKLRSIEAGKILANPPPGEEIVITGMAGKFPDSHNIEHFKENLYNKVDLISDDERRYKHEHPEIPKRGGKLFDAQKFDAGFFGIPYFQVHNMDPMCRILLERVFEAIIDSGYHPSELVGTRTGVYVGSCISESENVSFYGNIHEDAGSITGNVRSMLANQVSYFFKLNGPSIINDTACSSSMYSFEHAYRDLREGKCDYALVCGANLCLHPYVSLQFARLGVLSMDGSCKSFDNEANGYARSEGIVAVFLQKSKDARRIYARVLHAKTNCDGFKEQGITYPSGEVQKGLLEEFYKEVEIPPNSLSYMEAHGTGTKVGDPEELATIDEVFCTERDRPLLIGSVKSNIGHNEPVSGLCSIVKVVIGFENGYIPPNLNFKSIREGVEGLEKKRMVVVDEKIPWQDNDGLVGINSFGFGGGNSHILLKWNEKIEPSVTVKDNLPRLVCLSGRVPNATFDIFNKVVEEPLNPEYIALLQHSFSKNISGHQHRGYLLVNKNGEICRSEEYYDEVHKPLCYLLGAQDNKWPAVGHQLFSIPLFTGQIQRLHDVYSKYKLPVNVSEVINSYKADNLTHYVIATVAIQLSLVETLKSLQVNPKKVVGYSLGAITSAYLENTLTFEEAALTAFYTSLTFNEVLEKGENNKDKIVLTKTVDHLSKYMTQACPKLNKKVVNNLVDSILNVKLEDVKKLLPKESVICEIGAGNLKKNDNVVNLVDVGIKDAAENFLESLGKLYQKGVNIFLPDLYPKVQFPVSRGTPMVSPYIKWNHEKDWYVMNYKEWVDQHFGYKIVGINAKDEEWSYLTGHVIDGRNLFPATGYLCLIWTLYASMWKQMISECKVAFENVRFIRAVNIPKNGALTIMLTIQKNSGKFEVVEGDVAVVTGRIYQYKDDKVLGKFSQTNIGNNEDDDSLPLAEKDIYKELRLRGYNYSGLFKGVKTCDKSATVGYIEWKNNFTAFMDNMLQMKILQEDTRNLYVPTGINHIVIDPRKHLALIENLQQENPLVPVYVNKNTGVIRSNFIEIRGLMASPIPRRKAMAEPVLETYKFVPNESMLSLKQSVRTCLQIILENAMTIKAKAVEVPPNGVDEEYKYISPIILEVLGDLPLMQPEVSLLTEAQVERTGITVENKNILDETNCLLVILSNSSGKDNELSEISEKVLRENGMILLREKQGTDFNLSGFEKITEHQTEDETIILVKKKKAENKQRTFIQVPNNTHDFSFLETLKNTAKNDNQEIVLYAQKDAKNGILGLVNCLRREPKGEKFKAVFVQDENVEFDLTALGKQLDKGLAVNVFKDGKWGTYRHLLLDANIVTQAEHAYAIVGNPGDLSTLQWIEGTLKSDSELETGMELVEIYYSSLNFRDIMTSSGKISADVITRDRTKQMCIQGFEFVGKTMSGRRVYGLISSGAMSSLTLCRRDRLYTLPDHLSMAECATLIAVNMTVLVSFVQEGRIKPGDSVLIHAGSGGIGQAAITIATYYGCTIFTTVGTQEKRDFIKANFPNVRDSHIGNSRDTSFEQMVMYHTKGRGVDIVLNSLAEEKLRASVRCLAKGGRFLEIGKFDLANDNPLMLEAFAKAASFHSIMLDMQMDGRTNKPAEMEELFLDFAKNKVIKPLPWTMFQANELEQAFRFMASGKHIGKVLLKMRNEDQPANEKPELFTCNKRYYCDPERTIIIIGGLGGFGLELADWLILRNARKVILTSRKGVTTGYQSLRIRIWKSYGVDVVVSTEDVIKKDACERLLKMANSMGTVQAIFNLGVVLRDAILENQTVEDFQTSFAPKAYATQYLDDLTRVMCPELRDFVIFSSVSCGRGNAGQTNYGMANSIMERICEDRKKNGYPALAIEWGAIGDVGLVAEMQESNTELVIGGTLQQRITSCLSVLDTFLFQNDPIVSSMVVAEKRGGGNFDNAIDAIANILGLRDIKTVSPHQTLPELGMDSIMAVEIKQILESEYEIVLTPQEIRGMTFARIQELEKAKESGDSKATDNFETGINAFEMFLGAVGAKIEVDVNKPYIVTKPRNNPTEEITILIPGVEGFATVMEPLANILNLPSTCLQIEDLGKEEDIVKLAHVLFEHTKTIIGEDKKTFKIVAYSFGVIVTLELLSLLEADGYEGKAIFIDGSPDVFQKICERNLGNVSDRAMYETNVLCKIMNTYISSHAVEAVGMTMYKCKTFEERVKVGLNHVPKDFPYSEDVLTSMARRFCERTLSVLQYRKTFDKIKTHCKLIRPKDPIVYNYDEDYKLSDHCENFEGVQIVEGNHLTVLSQPELNDIIVEYFTNE